MVINQIYCKLGKRRFIDFVKKNGFRTGRINPCRKLSENDFTSFRVFGEDTDNFINYLKNNNIDYSIKNIV